MEKGLRTAAESDKDQEEFCTARSSGKGNRMFTFNNHIAATESFLTSHGFSVLVLLIYANALALMFVWGARDEFVHSTTPILRWIISIARGFGYTLNLNCALVIVLASRLSFTALRETPLCLIIPFDKCFPEFHMAVAYVIVAAVMGHSFFHMVWIIRWNKWKSGVWGINMCVGTGFALLATLGVMVFSSTKRTRKAQFTLFYAVHMVGAFLFYCILLIHGVYNGVPYTYKWIAGPLGIYVIDRITRRVKISTSNIHLNSKNSILKGANVLKVRIPKQFKFRAGQYAELKVPSINRYEWHPFSIASAPFEESMCFYIKTLGDWTSKLRNSLEERLSGTTAETLQVLIRGPFGAPAQHVKGYQRVVLISGGVGATPFASICKELYHCLTLSNNVNGSMDALENGDSTAVAKAEQELMDCVSALYKKQTEPQIGYEGIQSPLSLSNLFVFSNETRSPNLTLPFGGQEVFCSAKQRHEGNEQSHFNCSSNEPRGTKASAHLDLLGLSFADVRNTGIRSSGMELRGEVQYERFERLFWNNGFLNDTVEAAKAVGMNTFVKRRERVLRFLHSVSLNMLLCVTMVLRISVVGFASIFESSMLSSSQNSSDRELWLVGLDACLGLLMVVVILVALIMEAFVYKTAIFKSFGRALDICVLLPMSILSVLYCFHAAFDGQFMSFLPSRIYFLVVLPLHLALLAYRLSRVIGSRVLLAQSFRGSSFRKLRAIDFIWTVPYEGDDDWLREELEPFANGTQLRLHRFVTRQSKEVAEEGNCPSGMHTNFGRPDWEELFRKIAERTPSNGMVGVFFCGPKGMSKAIKETIMRVQVLTNMRGMYLGSSSDVFLQAELNIEGQEELRRIRARGSNIRFVFREENF